MSLVVTMEAVAAIRALADRIEELNGALVSNAGTLLTGYEENKQGLGRHSASIAALLEDLQRESASEKNVNLLIKRLRNSADNRQAHIEGSFPAPEITPPNKEQVYVAGVLGRIYAAGYRKMRRPSADGTWQGDVFIPDLSFKPTKYNPEGRTFAEIVAHLKTAYGIDYTGTPFLEGFADFSQIALAQIGLDDIAGAHCSDFLLHSDQLDYGEIFSERSQNFHYADQIAASKQLPIRGLASGYTAADLARWRKAHHFTWDESDINGYLLVPSEIHNNIPHTGLVGMSCHGAQAEEKITQRLRSYADIEDDF